MCFIKIPALNSEFVTYNLHIILYIYTFRPLYLVQSVSNQRQNRVLKL